MQIREHNLLPEERYLRAWLMAVLSVGLVAVADPVQAAAVDERAPQIVNDEPVLEGAVISPTEPVGAAPRISADSPPAKPITSGDEMVRKATVESTALLDPTEEVRPAEVPGAGPMGLPLLPVPAGGNSLRSPLNTPESAPSLTPVQRVQPIIATTPFPREQSPHGEPVMMGTDLQPNEAVAALSPEQTPPEFLDAPVVEETDHWVFGLEVASFYDDNIRLSSRDAQQDFLFVLSASIAWQQGDITRKRGSWARVFYEATGIVFVEESSENNVDHDFQAGGQKRWGSLAAALEGRFRRLSGATPDLGDRVQRNDFNVKAGGTYELAGRTFVEANVAWNGVRYQDATLADYDEWVTEGFAGYELSGRTRVAAGGAVGRLDVAGAGRQDFQRALLKVNRTSSGALGLTGKAGAEFRQTGRGHGVTPVFAVTADWEPVEDGTRISVEAFRETVSSGALAGENYLRTGGAVRLVQQLGDRIAAGLEAGYEQLNYSETAEGTASGRSDDYFFARPSLKYEFAARRRAEIFYSFREDDSSEDDFSFTANQWGLSVGLDF